MYSKNKTISYCNLYLHLGERILLSLKDFENEIVIAFFPQIFLYGAVW